MIIDARTTLTMVIGCPIEHSQSPLLHNTIYEYLGLNSVCLAFSPPNLETFIPMIRALKMGLTAVTLPFKQKIMAHLGACSEVAQRIQAVNTVIWRDGALYGENTDVVGIAYALRALTLAQKNILIIGAGGAACAAGYYLQQQQANIFWLNRTRANAERLVNRFGGEFITRDQLDDQALALIINTTPIGLVPHHHQSPLAGYRFNHRQAVFDMVYRPSMTQLLQQARQDGAMTISGMDMFIGQGLRQVELWQGMTIHDQTLRETLTSRLSIGGEI